MKREETLAVRMAFVFRAKVFLVAVVLAIPLLLGACSPQGKPAKDSEVNEPGKVSRPEAIESATVRIEAEGSFADLESGQQTSDEWAGSGFIIDPSGIAVTNNHVVTGSALLQVYVAGEDKPRNATVLGVSECSDLAVIDIEGDGYPYFGWHGGEISAGLNVYAAGFPLGDPEFTLTKGILSKAEADGEMSWASVDSVVEHDATINPGSSGGPLVDDTGKVVGINYSGLSETDQYWAISSQEALAIIGQLRREQDVDSIGVNGEAVTEDMGGPGIWAYSVESGSPAAEAGVKAGDLITKLEGLKLAAGGTMADYCDILRTHSPEDTLSIEVLRPETGEVLEGELNGRNLEPVDASSPEAGYTAITDDSESLVMDVPSGWAEVSGAPWEFGGETVGPGLSAAADLDAFWSTWGEPGVDFFASEDLAQEYTVEQYLDSQDFSDSCTYDDRYDYPSDGLYEGKYDLWENCGEEGSTFMVLAAVPENQQFLVGVQIIMLSEADLEARDQILNTFQVVGEL